LRDLQWIKRLLLCVQRHTVLPIPGINRVSADDLGWSAIFLTLPALLAGGGMLLARYLTGVLVPYYVAPFILMVGAEYAVSSLDQARYMALGDSAVEKNYFWSRIAVLIFPLAKIFLLAETAEYYFGLEMIGLIVAVPIAGRVGWLTAAAAVDRGEKHEEPALFQQIGIPQWSVGIVLLIIPLLFFFMWKSFFLVIPLFSIIFVLAWVMDKTSMEKRRIVGICAEFAEVLFLLLVPVLMYVAERIL
jgi:cobalamin synthase